MKHPERVEDYLEHIAEAIHWATDYIDRLEGIAAFKQSRRDQDAVIRNIEIVGEAASRIQLQAPDFPKAHPELPWVEMRGMRNKMIHNYFDVQVEIVWNTVKNDFPKLLQQIDSLLNDYKYGSEREKD
ncbi:MAG TPA: DUF86 domain-containing protein [Acidisarcina sp.]